MNIFDILALLQALGAGIVIILGTIVIINGLKDGNNGN